jgi:hypothetical protein
MPRILVVPEQLYQTSHTFAAAAADLREISHRLVRAHASLSWESRHKIGMEHRFREAARRAEQLAAGIGDLSSHLRTISERFRSLDQDCASQLGPALRRSLGIADPYLLASFSLTSLLPTIGMNWGALVEPKKLIGNLAVMHEVYTTVTNRMKGFYVEYVKRRSGDFYRVHNGQVVGIKGRKYAISNQHMTPQVAKYLNPKYAALEAVKWKSLKSLGGLGLAAEAVMGIKENVDNNASGSKIAAEAVVDVGIGLGSMAAGAAIGAKTGALVGSVFPGAGTVVGGVVGAVAGVGISIVTDVIQINGKSISDWAKDGVKGLIDGGANLIKSAGDALGSLFGG